MAVQVIAKSINYKSVDVEFIDSSNNPVAFIPPTDNFIIETSLSDGSEIIYNKAKTIATLLIQNYGDLLSLNTEYTVKFLRNTT